MRAARWSCRLCDATGVGGPSGWMTHRAARHDGYAGQTGSSVTLGFTGDRRPARGVRGATWGKPAWAVGFTSRERQTAP